MLRYRGRRLYAGWLRGFPDHDPAAELSRVNVPVLALTGASDLQVDPGDLERLRNLVRDVLLETHRVPQVNHALRHTDGVGSPTECHKQVRAGQTYRADRTHASRSATPLLRLRPARG